MNEVILRYEESRGTYNCVYMYVFTYVYSIAIGIMDSF